MATFTHRQGQFLAFIYLYRKLHRRSPAEGPPIRSQEMFIEIARAEAVHLGPYEEIFRRPGSFRRKAKKKKK